MTCHPTLAFCPSPLAQVSGEAAPTFSPMSVSLPRALPLDTKSLLGIRFLGLLGSGVCVCVWRRRRRGLGGSVPRGHGEEGGGAADADPNKGGHTRIRRILCQGSDAQLRRAVPAGSRDVSLRTILIALSPCVRASLQVGVMGVGELRSGRSMVGGEVGIPVHDHPVMPKKVASFSRDSPCVAVSPSVSLAF